MQSNTIDTLVIFDRLKKSFTEEQAHAISEIVKDLQEENLQASVSKADLKLAVEQLRKEIKDLELRITIRFGVMLAAVVAILAAIIKL